MSEPSLRPRRSVTIFHALTVSFALFAAVEAADFCSRYGLWAGIFSFAAVLVAAYFVIWFFMTAFVIWLWNHCPYGRVRHDAACYLLSEIKDPQLIEAQIDREFGDGDTSQGNK